MKSIPNHENEIMLKTKLMFTLSMTFEVYIFHRFQRYVLVAIDSFSNFHCTLAFKKMLLPLTMLLKTF